MKFLLRYCPKCDGPSITGELDVRSNSVWHDTCPRCRSRRSISVMDDQHPVPNEPTAELNRIDPQRGVSCSWCNNPADFDVVGCDLHLCRICLKRWMGGTV